MSETADLTTRGTPRVRKPKVPRPTATTDMIGRAINQAFGRAMQNGDAFTDEAVNSLLSAGVVSCQLTGVPFSDDLVPGCRTRPWAPTVDRIDNSKGYVVGNVRLVCWAANRARGDWPDAVFWQMVEAAYRSRHG